MSRNILAFGNIQGEHGVSRTGPFFGAHIVVSKGIATLFGGKGLLNRERGRIGGEVRDHDWITSTVVSHVIAAVRALALSSVETG